MATTIELTDGNDRRSIIEPTTVRIDGKGGFDTIDWGTLEFSNFEITRDAQGVVHVDTVSGASGGGLHAQLLNIERLTFERGTVTIDLATYFADTTLVGTAASDGFKVGTGFSTVDGREGVDTVEVPYARASLRLSHSGATWTAAAVEGHATTVLTNVERLKLTDGQVALDVDGAAGRVAQILGAVFGPASVRDKALVGIGLGVADTGLSTPALVQLALDARLGAGASHAAVVDLLYTNVVGQAPSPAEAAPFLALLDSGAHTHASLGQLAAEHVLNLLHIDFAGISQHGLDYA